jgi:hypothetical protein
MLCRFGPKRAPPGNGGGLCRRLSRCSPPKTEREQQSVGSRSALLTVLKNGGSSTLDVIRQINAILPRIRSTLPPAFNLKLLFDQSIFVRAAIPGVLREAIVAAFLTGLIILLFLGSWRSTIVVCISIPLSILASLAVLYGLGETTNVMTLGGMALALGILVDDATVEIENIHRNLAQGKPIVRAIAIQSVLSSGDLSVIDLGRRLGDRYAVLPHSLQMKFDAFLHQPFDFLDRIGGSHAAWQVRSIGAVVTARRFFDDDSVFHFR